MQNLSSFSQGQPRFSNGFFGVYHSPFGVELKGRNLKKNNAKNYRFGFQGQEGDDQIKGDGNSVNYKYRMHDTRLGRFFAVDPLAGKYPHNSPYAFSENDVIACIELEGLEKWVVTNYRNEQGIIVYTFYEIYKQSASVAKMKLGKGILYQEKLLKADGSSGAAKTIFIDNENSSFQDLPAGNNHYSAMSQMVLILSGQGKGQKCTMENAVLHQLVVDPNNPQTGISGWKQYYRGSWKWNFENDKSDMFSGTKQEIAQMNDDIEMMAIFLAVNPGLTLTIEGHTSTQADDDYNLKLSQARADYVRTKILEQLPNGGKGFEKRIIAIGYGETKPIIPKDDTEQKQNVNRRTTITYVNNGTY
jgi:RHS repeat-associated protein